MPPIYSAVAYSKGATILAEYAAFAGNYAAVVRDFLAKASLSSPAAVPAAGGGGGGSGASPAAAAGVRSTYAVDGHLFSFLADAEGFTYVVVTDEASGRAVPNALLGKIKAEWAAKGYPDKVKQQAAQAARDAASASAAAAAAAAGPGAPPRPPPPAPAPAPVPAFSRRLKECLEHVTQYPEQYSRAAGVQARVDEVKQVMSDNIDKVLSRGEKLDVLVDKTDALQAEADRFVKGGRLLRRRMHCQNMKAKAVMGGCVVLVLTILFLLLCFSGGRSCVPRGKGGKGDDAAAGAAPAPAADAAAAAPPDGAAAAAPGK